MTTLALAGRLGTMGGSLLGLLLAVTLRGDRFLTVSIN